MRFAQWVASAINMVLQMAYGPTAFIVVGAVLLAGTTFNLFKENF